MGFMDELMEQAVPKLKALCGEDRADAVLLYQPIPNLQPGDRVRWKKGQSTCKFPQKDEIAEVHQVITPEVRSHMTMAGYQGNHACDMPDFTILFVDEKDGQIEEFPFDSRHFERVD
jgi:hypothetical protein